jgi:hypothetical protein
MLQSGLWIESYTIRIFQLLEIPEHTWFCKTQWTFLLYSLLHSFEVSKWCPNIWDICLLRQRGRGREAETAESSLAGVSLDNIINCTCRLLQPFSQDVAGCRTQGVRCEYLYTDFRIHCTSSWHAHAHARTHIHTCTVCITGQFNW